MCFYFSKKRTVGCKDMFFELQYFWSAELLSFASKGKRVLQHVGMLNCCQKYFEGLPILPKSLKELIYLYQERVIIIVKFPPILEFGLKSCPFLEQWIEILSISICCLEKLHTSFTKRQNKTIKKSKGWAKEA